MVTEPSWRDHDDRPIARPEPPPADAPPYWRDIGDFQGGDYRRNAFAQATDAELDALWRRLDLSAGVRILDVGCGTGRHLVAAARRGATGVGVDVSPGLVAAARDAVRAAGLDERVEVRTGDARDLGALGLGGPFDVAWSLSQGAIGTDLDADRSILAGMANVVRPGGQVVVTLFHALFAVRHLAPGDAFDPQRLLHHHVGEVRGRDDRRRAFDLWATAHTAPGARRLCEAAGLEVERIVGASPGDYARGDLGLDDPEMLVVCRRPVVADPRS